MPTTASCTAVQMDQILLHSCSLSSPVFFFSLKRVSFTITSFGPLSFAPIFFTYLFVSFFGQPFTLLMDTNTYIKGKKVIEIMKQTTNKEQESAGQSTVHKVIKKTK